MAKPIKDAIDISFAKGLDTKTDPWRVSVGNFLSLQNSVFTTGGRLTKRNGYGNFTSLPESATFLTTFNDNLTAIGSNIQAYSESTNSWINKGALQPVELSVLPLIRSNTNQSQVDTAVSSNNLVCTVYTDQDPSNLTAPQYMFAVLDAITGQNIIAPTVIAATSGSCNGAPRVFSLGIYFIIGFSTSSNHLQYIAINTRTYAVVAAADISTSTASSSTLSWDGVVANNTLFIAYNKSSGGQAIEVTSMTTNLVVALATTYSNSGKVTATIMSMCADTSGSLPIIYAAYYDSGSSTGYVIAVDINLNKIISTPAEIITSGTILNLTCIAINGVETTYYEVSNSYTYDSAIPTNYIDYITCTQTGSVGSSSTLARSVGIASKAFLLNGNTYLLTAYESFYQPTYFLMEGNGDIIARLAYANGGGYLTTGLPAPYLNENIVSIPYLYKDFITSEHTSTTQSITKSGIYSQTGINFANFTIGTSNVVPGEIASALHLSGGFLWEYDGYLPVEHNFFLWPDSVEGTGIDSGGAMLAQQYQYQVVYTWTDNQGNVHNSAPSIANIVDMSAANLAFTPPTPITTTGSGTTGSTQIAVASVVGMQIGQLITDTTNPTYIQAGTYITDISGPDLTISLPLAGTLSSDTVSIASICSVTLAVPTLRLTYKTENPIKISIYRWSVAQQIFYEVTSIEQPLLNDVTVDYVTFTDTQADNQILGNSLIYTTGGVVENIGAPSFNAITLFDNRLWGIDAEDPNLLWYSKQVIEAVPVEMSDLFTIYVAPTIASQGSTGPMQCLFPMDDKLIIFKKDALYFINGTGPDNTGSNSQYSQPIFITSTVGSVNQQSIVFTDDGLMFQSDKGIWILLRNAIQAVYIGAPVEKYTLTSQVNSAVVIPGTTQVRFTLDSGITLMYDYFYQQWGTFVNVPAISSTLYNNLHTYLSETGAIYQETPGLYLDGDSPVLMQFTTSWINLAGLQGYQRAFFFYILGQYKTPHYLNCAIAYDYAGSPLHSGLVQPLNYSPPYGGNGADSESPYGQQSPYGGPGNVESFRIFFKKQRCLAFQINVQEVYNPTLGAPAGEGLTLSGLNLIAGFKSKFHTIPAKHSIGVG